MKRESALDFLLNFTLKTAPQAVQEQVRLNILDVIGVGIAASNLPLSHIIRAHACEVFGGNLPLLFGAGRASAPGVALAGGMTIDALDAHDGHNLTKGHIGAALIPSIFALCAYQKSDDGEAFLNAIILGYELGVRFGQALHATASDYHSSGAWMAVAVAGVGAHMLGFGCEKTRHALGIAEYHGPRSQMMRCIDYPTMLKDGAGWGAMAGVSAVLLAKKGFSGAPALTFGTPEDIWDDLGQRWAVMEQYYKPYPVCRWAQAAIVAALGVREKYALSATDINRVDIISFHEAKRLAFTNPQNTEQAQYSLPFPVAVALARGTVRSEDLMGQGLEDKEILRIANATKVIESEYANAHFPKSRFARVKVFCQGKEGQRVLESDWHMPQWDYTIPPNAQDLERKFMDFARPVGKIKAHAIRDAVFALGRKKDALSCLTKQLYQPV